MPNRNRRGRGRGQAFRADADLTPHLGPIAGGVFQRLKIPCPPYFTSNTPKFYNSTTVPITFRGLPSLIKSICNEMSRIKVGNRATVGNRSDSDSSDSDSSDSDSSASDDYVDLNDPNDRKNQEILIKGALFLAETKMHLSARRCPHLERENCKVIHMMRDLAENLPKPLVEYLQCIGIVHAGRQVVRPVLAGAGGAGDDGHGGGAGGGAAPALAPCQLAPLLARLRGGAGGGGPADARAALRALPLRWDEAGGLADDCFRRWVADAGPHADPRYTLRWDDEDSRLFLSIMNSVRHCRGGNDFFGSINLDRREGSPAQFVQAPGWEECGRFAWYTMTAVGEEDVAKGATFGFGGAERQQPSRFTGTIVTSYQSGHYNRSPWSTEINMRNLIPSPLFGTIIPVTFSGLPGLVDRFWIESEMNPTGNPDCKATFIKAGLILAEAKVYFAQMASKHTVLDPGEMVKYSSERESILRRMPRWLPKPLAIYLECIGKTYAEGQEVTPVLAGGAGGGAAPALAPCQLAPLLARLRGGAGGGGPADARAALRALPLRWDEAGGLADDCFRRWVTDAGPHADPRYTLRWDDEDSRLFETAIRAMRPNILNDEFKNHLVYTEPTRGEGSPAQFVHSSAGKDLYCGFAMTEVDDASLKLGAMFGLGGAGAGADPRERPSRLAGPEAFALLKAQNLYSDYSVLH